jgi:hypothetical protein
MVRSLQPHFAGWDCPRSETTVAMPALVAKLQSIYHGAKVEGHGGPLESGLLDLQWPTVALRFCSVVIPGRELIDSPAARHRHGGFCVGMTN